MSRNDQKRVETNGKHMITGGKYVLKNAIKMLDARKKNKEILKRINFIIKKV